MTVYNLKGNKLLLGDKYGLNLKHDGKVKEIFNFSNQKQQKPSQYERAYEKKSRLNWRKGFQGAEKVYEQNHLFKSVMMASLRSHQSLMWGGVAERTSTCRRWWHMFALFECFTLAFQTFTHLQILTSCLFPQNNCRPPLAVRPCQRLVSACVGSVLASSIRKGQSGVVCSALHGDSRDVTCLSGQTSGWLFFFSVFETNSSERADGVCIQLSSFTVKRRFATVSHYSGDVNFDWATLTHEYALIQAILHVQGQYPAAR